MGHCVLETICRLFLVDTAKQADKVALEPYSLVRNGIELSLADHKPKEGTVTNFEWLDYAVGDVPKIYQDIKAGRSAAMVSGKKSLKDKTRAE